MSADLFVRTDGRPMVFLMNYVIEREDVRRAVEERGGVLVEDISPSICDNVIRLLARTEMAISRNYDMFYYHYIMDCIEADTLLPQLYRYRVCTSVPSPYGMYDPLDVLLGNIGWSEVPINGEVVSDTDNEVEMDEDTARAEAEYKAFKCEQIPFTDSERREIVNGVIARHSYAMVGGDLLWKIFEEKKLCRGRRTWQSMKEQFEKVIVPDIYNYGLNQEQIQLFQSALGLVTDTISESRESSCSPVRKGRYRDRNGGNRKGRKMQRKQESSVSPSPERFSEKKRKKGNRKLSIFPAESSSEEREVNTDKSLDSEDEKLPENVKENNVRSTEEGETEREVEQLLDSSTLPSVVRMASDSSLVVPRQEERLRNQESKDMFAETPLKHMDGNVIDCIGKEISTEECVEKSIEEGEDCFQDLSDNEEFGCDLMEDAVSTPSHLHVEGTEKHYGQNVPHIENLMDDSVSHNIGDQNKNLNVEIKASKDVPSVEIVLNDPNKGEENILLDTSEFVHEANNDHLNRVTDLIVTTEEENTSRRRSLRLRKSSPVRSSQVAAEILDGSRVCKMNAFRLSDEEEGNGNVFEGKGKSIDQELESSGNGKQNTGVMNEKLNETLFQNFQEDGESNMDVGDGVREKMTKTPGGNVRGQGKRVGGGKQPSVRRKYRKVGVETGGPRMLGVGRDRDGGVVVVLQGLPSDVDSEAEVVRTDLGVSGGARSVSGAMEEVPASPLVTNKNKLKIVTVKEPNYIMDKVEEQRKKVRRPYSKEEETAVINYFLTYGGYSCIKGSRIWKDMEAANICPGRSSHALKGHFLNHVSKRLEEFGVTVEQLKNADKKQKDDSC